VLLELDIDGSVGETLVPGDLLRITWGALGRRLYAVVVRPGTIVRVRIGGVFARG
jgi:hypothetical protein